MKQWVEKLGTSPAVSVRGLIDSDGTEQSSAGVVVLSRYSMENFLLDPVVVLGCLLNAKGRPDFFGHEFERPEAAQLRAIDREILQRTVNQFCSYVEANGPAAIKAVTGTFPTKYASGICLALPIWLRDVRGHDLMRAYRHAFQPKYIVENVFKNKYEKLISILTEVLPEFIPLELEDMMKSLQSS